MVLGRESGQDNGLGMKNLRSMHTKVAWAAGIVLVAALAVTVALLVVLFLYILMGSGGDAILLSVFVVLVTGMFFGLKVRYGDYSHYTYVKVDLPRAGQLLRTGTDVRERGVVIGKVSNIQLVNRHAELTLQIDSPYRIPRDVEAAVDLKTLLGDKYVDLRSPTFGPPLSQEALACSERTVIPRWPRIFACAT